MRSSRSITGLRGVRNGRFAAEIKGRKIAAQNRAYGNRWRMPSEKHRSQLRDLVIERRSPGSIDAPRGGFYDPPADAWPDSRRNRPGPGRILPRLRMMRSEPIVVLGAGGHAQVVVATLLDCDLPIAGLFDDDAQKWGQSVLGIPILGPLSDIPDSWRKKRD